MWARVKGFIMTVELGVVIAFIALCGGVIVRDRQVVKMVKDGDEKHGESLKKSEENLHHRINEVKDTHVRKDDMRDLIGSVNKRMDNINNLVQETNNRLYDLVNTLAGSANK